jgi:hypothetical protein
MENPVQYLVFPNTKLQVKPMSLEDATQNKSGAVCSCGGNKSFKCVLYDFAHHTVLDVPFVAHTNLRSWEASTAIPRQLQFCEPRM